jgi:hypothetical protein
MPPRLVLDGKLLLENPFIVLRPKGLRTKSHSSLAENPFMASKPIHAPLTKDPRPAQYALGFSALEWQGYRAACIRVRQSGASGSSAAERSKKGPDAEALDP